MTFTDKRYSIGTTLWISQKNGERMVGTLLGYIDDTTIKISLEKDEESEERIINIKDLIAFFDV